MAHEIKMPQLGLTMTEGTVGRWLKNEGDTVNLGEPLVEIETDKLTSEIESEFSGVLLKIIQKEGDEVPVQGLLALIGEANEVATSSEAVSPTAVTLAVPNAPPPAHIAAVASDAAIISSLSGRIKVSPLAKKIAKERNIDLASVVATGPGGRIVKSDIDNYQHTATATATATPVPTSVAAPARVNGAVALSHTRREKMKSMRKTVATRMLQSHTEIPNVTQTIKVEVTALLALRKQLNQERAEDNRLSVNDFILKATAKALAQHKEILVSIDGDEIIYHDEVNLGMAVGLDSGLVVPVIHQADLLALGHLSDTAKCLAKKAREGTLLADDYQGHTFTLSNLGMYGIESFTPIINQPDAAILGVCAVQEELALDKAGAVVSQQNMRLSMTFDHRLLDGAVVAKFQQTLRKLLENPMNILL